MTQRESDMDGLAGIGVFFAGFLGGLGAFFAGIGILWWVSLWKVRR